MATNEQLIYVESYILEKGFLTGSRAWGLNTSDSDYDYILYGEDFYRIKGDIEAYGIPTEPSTYMAGFYIVLGDKKYNLFTHLKSAVDDIRNTTEIMKSWPKGMLQDKNKRVYVFVTIQNILRCLQ